MRTAVEGARAAANPPGAAPAASMFDSCLAAVNIAERRTRAARDNKGAEQYARVLALLPDDEDRLNAVIEACRDLAAAPGNTAIAQAAERLRAAATNLFNEFGQIDDGMAARGAEAEMGYVRRILDTLLYEANLFALSPVAMFDVARVWSSGGPDVTRFGAGGGLRLTLISHVSFTAGYLVNPRRESNEPRGAFSFSLGFRDLFQ
jgi:hypothetical protein